MKFNCDMDIKKIGPFFGQTDRQTDRPTDRQTDGPTDRKTDRPTFVILNST